MNRHEKFPAASKVPCAAIPVPGEARAPVTPSCPQCDCALEDRFYDEEARVSYPCDDGEGYCASCDSIWSIDQDPTWEEFAAPFKRLADGFLRVEL